jgi:rhomboid protease GluP
MSTSSEVLEIPVSPRQASLVPSALGALVVAAVITFMLAGLLLAEGRGETGWIFLLSAFFGASVGVVVFAFHRQKQYPSVLQIEPDQVRLRNTVRGGEVTLPYRDLWSARKQGQGRQELLVLATREKALIVVPTAFLPATQGADSILEAIRERAGDLPERPVVDSALRRTLPQLSLWRSSTFAVAVLLSLVSLAELAVGAFSHPIRLWAFGANSFPLVKNGELFRLATANVLHGNLIHLFFNLMALLSFGLFLEPLLGRGRFLSVLLVSSLAGAAGSAFLGHHVLSVGASTGIAGLVGAYVVVLLRWRDQLPHPPTKSTWIWLAAMLLWPALTIKNVDNFGHLTGFLAGFCFVFLEARTAALTALADRRRGIFRVTGALLAALFLAAGGIAVQRARDGRDRQDVFVLLRDTSVPPGMLNDLAWSVAADPAASRTDLTTALQGVERAVQKEPKAQWERDTRATVLYRLGRWQEAIQAEYDLSAAARSPLYVSQLARFEWASARARGPLILGQPPAALPRARLDPGGSILVDLGGRSLLSRAILHLVLATGEKPSALLELKPGASETILRYSLPRDLSFPKPDGVSLTLLDTRGLEEPRNETHWELQPIVPEVAGLP